MRLEKCGLMQRVICCQPSKGLSVCGERVLKMGGAGDPPTHVFSVVGTSRCDVRAACSGATPSHDSAARSFVPPAYTRAGTAQSAIPTVALTTYSPTGTSASNAAKRPCPSLELSL